VRVLVASFILVVGILFAGCASQIGRVTTNYDKFKESNVEVVQVGNTVRLMRLANTSATPTYAFVVEGYSSGNQAAWPNELVFLLDGEQMRLHGGSSLEDVNVSQYSVSYYERAIFPVTGQQIRRVADASSVEVRMYGRNRSFPGVTWDEPRIQAVGKFHRLFVQRDWDSMNSEERASLSKPGSGL